MRLLMDSLSIRSWVHSYTIGTEFYAASVWHQVTSHTRNLMDNVHQVGVGSFPMQYDNWLSTSYRVPLLIVLKITLNNVKYCTQNQNLDEYVAFTV
jgi:hypothetical protein